MAQLQVYTLGGATPLATLEVGAADWLRRANEHGAGRARVNGTVASSLLADDVYIRVHDGTRDVFAFLPLSKPRKQMGAGSEVDLAGPGVRWIWTRALIYPESDCVPTDVRWFGPMSAAYTPDGDWTSPVSHGRHDAFVFGNDRGEGFADRSAQLISYTTSQNLNALRWAHRATFTLSEDTDVVIQAYGDDFYRTWLNASPLTELTTPERPYNWRNIQEWRGTLCAGTHVLYFEPGNLDANVAGANPTYLAWSVMRAAGDGGPAAAHHVTSITHNGTGGTWYGIVDGTPTANIDWDASTSAVQTAFNDVVGDGEIEVTGSPGAYTITFNGPTSGYTAHAVSADDALLSGGTIAVQTSTYGASGDYIAHSDTSTGVVLPPGSGTKGLTPHEIWAEIISDEQAKGDTWLDHIQLTDTDATTDSAGNAWPELVLEVALDNANGDRVNEMMIEAGIKIDVTPDLIMQGWGGTRGTDRSATVAYTIGDGCRVPQAGHDTSAVVNVLRWLSSEGWTESTDAGSITTHGRAGDVIRLDTYDDTGAGQFTPQLLDDLKEPQEPVVVEFSSVHPLQPGDDYDLADVIGAPAWGTSGFAATDIRVMELGGRLHGSGHIWTLRGTT